MCLKRKHQKSKIETKITNEEKIRIKKSNNNEI